MTAALIAKVGGAVVRGRGEQLVRVSLSGSYAAAACHSNLARWVSEYPGDRAVLGWLINAGGVYVLH